MHVKMRRIVPSKEQQPPSTLLTSRDVLTLKQIQEVTHSKNIMGMRKISIALLAVCQLFPNIGLHLGVEHGIFLEYPHGPTKNFDQAQTAQFHPGYCLCIKLQTDRSYLFV